MTRSTGARERLHEMWGTLAGPSTVKNARAIPKFAPFTLERSQGMRFLILGDWGTGGKGDA